MTTIDQVAAKFQKAIAAQQPTITAKANGLVVERAGTTVRIPQIPQGTASRVTGFR